MTSTLNPHFLSEMLALPVRNLQDGTDYPHSGIFDMLHKGLKGSFAIKASVTDFDITQSDGGSFTQIVIAAGYVLRDGITAAVVSDTILLDTSVAEGGFTTNGTSATANQDVTPVSGGDVYLMIVVDAANALKIRGRNADINKAPMILTTDIPVAMIKMVADSADDAIGRPVQYFTTDKTANGLTLMYDNSGVAGLAGYISSTSAATTWGTTNDITIKHVAASQTDLIIQDAIPTDAATGPSLSLKNNRPTATNNDIAGTINFVAADNAGSSADSPTASIVSKILNVAAGNEFADLRINIANQNGTLVETLSLVGSAAAADTRIGIRKAAPESTLEINGSIGAQLLELTAGGTMDVNASYVVINSTGGGGSVTLNLPAVADCTNRIYHIKCDGSDAVSVDPNASETIKEHAGAATSATIDVLPGMWIIIQGGASQWRLMAKGTVL